MPPIRLGSGARDSSRKTAIAECARTTGESDRERNIDFTHGDFPVLIRAIAVEPMT